MKKLFAMMLAVLMVAALFAGCQNETNPTVPSTEPSQTPTEPSSDPTEATGDATTVMTHEEFLAAAEDDAVEIECYVQATQGWWEDKIVIYAQDANGGYFAYNVACSQEDSAKLVPGTKINIKGYKTFYKGMPEVSAGATFTIVEGADSYIATAEDMTALLGKDELVEKAGMLAAFKGMTVEPIKDANGAEAAFLYNWDGSGQQGSDLYFNVSVNGATYNFCVESYLCGADTDVYKAVEALQIGDVIDLEGFIYWYDGINPHITAVTPVAG